MQGLSASIQMGAWVGSERNLWEFLCLPAGLDLPVSGSSGSAFIREEGDAFNAYLALVLPLSRMNSLPQGDRTSN
jgi:hypothetical protein